MIREHKFVADYAVVEFFAGRTKREREDLLRIFAGLAASPYEKGEWQQRTSSGRVLQVRRLGRWLVRSKMQSIRKSGSARQWPSFLNGLHQR